MLRICGDDRTVRAFGQRSDQISAAPTHGPLIEIN
jgi:hypothetical protein